MPLLPRIAIGPGERVWVTGDVHLGPDDDARVEFFLRFLTEARRSADRLVLLGDIFDYWIGPTHARGCAYRSVVEAFEQAGRDGFPIEFIAGNRDFLGPEELREIGLRVHGDAVVLDRAGERTIVTHGDLLVKGDLSYKRYRCFARSWAFHTAYWIVPKWFRLPVAHLLRGASQRKLVSIEAYDFPIDLERSRAWMLAHGARELLMGHLHREETHQHEGVTTRMLPGWGSNSGPHFVFGPDSELRTFR